MRNDRNLAGDSSFPASAYNAASSAYDEDTAMSANEANANNVANAYRPINAMNTDYEHRPAPLRRLVQGGAKDRQHAPKRRHHVALAVRRHVVHAAVRDQVRHVAAIDA